MAREITRKFNDIGEVITIQLKYEDLEVYQLPKSCYSCPVGFMKYGCGREVPLTSNGRPKTCKLTEIDIGI